MLRASSTNYVILLLLMITLIGACTDEEPPNAPDSPNTTYNLILQASIKTIAAGQSVSFTALCTGGQLTSPLYIWDYGESTSRDTSSSNSQTHVFSTEGTYHVSVRLLDAQHAVDLVDSVVINVESDPRDTTSVVIRVNSTQVDANTSIAFSADYTGPTLSNPQYRWNFGDGTPEGVRTTDTISHTFTKEGTVFVTLQLVDGTAGVAAGDVVKMEIIDDRPLWYDWSRMTISLHATFRGNTDTNPSNSDTTLVVTETRQYGVGSVGHPWTWAGTTGSFDTSYSHDEFCTSFLDLRVKLLNGGTGINTFSMESSHSCRVGTRTSGETDKLKFRSIPLVGNITRDSALYRLEGEVLKDRVVELYHLDYRSGESSPRLTSIDRTSDAWIEIRFYKQ